MLYFKDICRYENGYDIDWYTIRFPSELPNAKFVDGWVRIPRSESPGSRVSYSIEQSFSLAGASSQDPVQYTSDFKKSGTATVTSDRYIEPLDEAAYREKVVSRFRTRTTGNHLFSHVWMVDRSTGKAIIGAYFLLRVGADNYEVAELAVSSNCMDEAIKLTWEITAQTVQAIALVNAQGTTVYQSTQTIKTPTHTIPAGTILPGKYTLRVQSGYDLSEGVRVEDVGVTTPVAELPLVIWRIEPKIIAFEPNGVAQNREKAIVITWNSEQQQSYVLKVKQNGTVVKEYSGSTGKSATIAPNTLASGVTEIELRIKYIPTWGTEANALYASETIQFQAYGTPPLPVISTASTVNTAFPNITWTSGEQYSFRLKIFSNEILLQDTGEVPSELQQYTVTKPLANGDYTLKLIVKNQYGLYSPEAGKTLTVSYILPQKPELYCAGDDACGSISVRVYNTNTGNFSHCDLFRKFDGEWMRIAENQPATFEYIDFRIKSGISYQYMARAIGSSSGYQDSDVKWAQANVVSTQLFEPDMPEKPINLRLNPEREETVLRSVHFMSYAGIQEPVVEFGEEQYCKISLSFFARAVDAERLKLLYFTASVLCYRDNRGRFLYGFISSDPHIKDAAWGWCTVSFDFTQAHYTEEV